MKNQYLNELRSILNQFEMSQTEREDILNDYSTMYQDGLDKGMSDKEVVELLGTPEKVGNALSDEYPREANHQSMRGNKIVALMPFLATIAFFILGFYFDLWHPGWMVFLAIPVTAILIGFFNHKNEHTLTALSPFIAVVFYLFMGFAFNIWHPTWLVFLIIPVIAILNSFRAYDGIGRPRKTLDGLIALSPFIAVSTFLLVGFYANVWNPTWLIFLLTPMLALLYVKPRWKLVLMEGSFLLAIGIYLYVGYTMNDWWLGALGFLIPLIVGVLTHEVSFSFGGGSMLDKLTFLGCIIIYALGGVFFDAWGYLWMIFLLIPVIAILSHGPKKHRFVAITPFIAVVTFFSLGYIWGLWEVSWLAFLLIPIAGILDK